MPARDSFVGRLKLGLAVLIVASLAGLLAVVAAERRLGAAIGRSQQAVELLDRFKEVRIRFSAARAAEREFLLEDLRAPNFFQTGRTPALEAHARALAELDTLLTFLAAQPEAEALRVAEMRQAVSGYSERFRQLVSLYRKRGSLYSGLLGEMREALFSMQEMIDRLPSRAQTRLRAELLELIRDQGDYLRDLDNRPRFLVGQRIEVLGEEIDALGARALREPLASYARAWRELVEIDDRIGRSSGAGVRGELRSAQERVIPLSVAAVERSRERFGAASASLAKTAVWTRAITSTVALGIAVIALFLSITLARQVREPLARILAAVEAYARGDREARVGPLARRDEFAVLGEAFDRMAETLAEAHEELEEMNASLELAVKGDTTGLLARVRALAAQRREKGLGRS